MEEVVYIKVFDNEKGDIVFEGKVSADVAPDELVNFRCFWERNLNSILNKATGKQLKSFKGLHNAELVASSEGYSRFSGVLYVSANDGVLRKSESVPSCDCAKMSVWRLSQEACEKAFKCETLEELGINYCRLRQMPNDIGKMKVMKKISLLGLQELKSVPQEIILIGEFLELCIEWTGIESLPKELKSSLKSIRLLFLNGLQFRAEDVAVFSKLKRLVIKWCNDFSRPSFAQAFWDMIKLTVDLRCLDVDWKRQSQEMVASALEENGSIVDGGSESELYAHFFKRNKENHERAMECVVQLLAIRRWRDALDGIPKEMIQMLAVLVWVMRCDVKAWVRSDGETN